MRTSYLFIVLVVGITISITSGSLKRKILGKTTSSSVNIASQNGVMGEEIKSLARSAEQEKNDGEKTGEKTGEETEKKKKKDDQGGDDFEDDLEDLVMKKIKQKRLARGDEDQVETEDDCSPENLCIMYNEAENAITEYTGDDDEAEGASQLFKKALSLITKKRLSKEDIQPDPANINPDSANTNMCVHVP